MESSIKIKNKLLQLEKTQVENFDNFSHELSHSIKNVPTQG